MSEHSEIEWTDATWNPVRGCTKITPGCDHCYAETFAERFRGVPGHPYEQGFDLRLVPEKLAEPLRWKTPKMIFVNSHERPVPQGRSRRLRRGRLPARWRRANWHTYQVLTKRFVAAAGHASDSGCSSRPACRTSGGACQRRGPGARSAPDRPPSSRPRLAVRFLSIEPLLEDLGEINLEGIHWVIVGGESGAGARPHAEGVGACRSATSASGPRCLSSSSSGAGSARARPAGSWTGEIRRAAHTSGASHPRKPPAFGGNCQG